jgi:queuine tRNA-ribosyltransferase
MSPASRGTSVPVEFSRLAEATGSRARAGRITTAHGVIETPVFMPVGTRGAVRTQTREQLAALGPKIILGNTFHLMLRPGRELFERVGGLHAWMKWPGALLTDSGGFQVFSLSRNATVSEDGVEFRSTADGRRITLTPESSIGMQRAIGSDIMMVFDHLIDSTSPLALAEEAMHRTHRWAARSLAARAGSPNALFAIVQGACFPALRRVSADVLTTMPGFDGYAIGGLAVGETRAEREDTTELVTELLPRDKPRYLMGVGTPLDLIEGVHRGVDMFDCVLPTAWAQQGLAFTSRGRIDLARGVHAAAEVALDPACPCEACATYSRSYLHHLVKCKEPLGWQLLSFHNLRFYLSLMEELRTAIRTDTFAAIYPQRRDELGRSDVDNPPGKVPRAKPKTATTRGAFSLVVSPQGFTSVQHVASGEVMHSVNDPDVEARRVYVDQPRAIADALAGRRDIVVWDVGLGAAHNALALIRAVEAAPATSRVRIVSFEHDLDALRLGLDHQKPFIHLRHEGPHRLLRGEAYERGPIRWDLVDGDALAGMTTAPRPDVIFWDPFSAKTDTRMWTLDAFRQLFALLDRPTEVITYSASTAVRSSLLAAGFYVARGVPSGPKEETTIALAHPTADDLAHHRVLGADWLARRARSTAKLGADISPDERDALEQAITSHPQFVRT